MLRHSLLLSLILLLGIPLTYSQQALADRLPTDMKVLLNRSIATDEEKDTIQKIIKNFYDDCMEYQVEVIGSGFLNPFPLGSDGEPDIIGNDTLAAGEPLTLPQFLRRHPDVTQAFAHKINDMLVAAENDEYPEMGIDHDPILMAQDIPKALRIERIEITRIISGDAATV